MTSLPTTSASAPTTPMSPRRVTLMAGVAGLVGAVVTLAVAEVLSLVLGGRGNPILAVGSLIVDIVPPGFKSLIIDLFDTADKLVLFISLGLVVLVFAVAAGILQVRRPPLGVLVVIVVAAVAALAVVTRAGASPLDALPTVAGAVVGVLVLRVLVVRLAAWRDAPVRRASPAVGAQYERRRFLRLVLAAGITSAIVGAGARFVNSASAVVSDLRRGIRLPTPASAGPAIPADATLNVPGISAFVTPNPEFYRIDTALQVPSIDPRTWKLRITGMVEQTVEVTYDELVALPLTERLVTIACVSNDVGGSLIGNALWLGYPIRELLARARPIGGADMVLSRSIDGFTASSPLSTLQDPGTDALLAVGMNGDPLPLEHGFPVRMIVPGLYGYVSATKWLVELEVTRFADKVAYWTPRGWSERGPIKLSSRIDTPRSGVSAGTVTVAGVAWAQHTGVSRVEVQIDGGAWSDATLARVVTVDSWLQWSYAWDATPGVHDIVVRATDNNGIVQTAEVRRVDPDGATGLHSVSVRVA